MLTIEKFISMLEPTKFGCLIYSRGNTRSIGHCKKPISIIRELFRYYGKEYKGKVIRTCGNRQCWNIEHILSYSPEERFWSNINIKSDNECWEWKGTAGTGKYGNTSINGKDIQVHRKAYEFTFGEIPDGMCICHHCDNPPCCNPKHLFLGTRQDNIDDRERKGRNKLPFSKGEEHGHHKLTENQVKEIRTLHKMGNYGYRKLGKLYSITWEEIRKIIKRQTWAWLED